MSFERHYQTATKYLNFRLRHNSDREAIRDDCLSRLWEVWQEWQKWQTLDCPNQRFSVQQVCRTLLYNHKRSELRRKRKHYTATDARQVEYSEPTSPDETVKLQSHIVKMRARSIDRPVIDSSLASVDLADLTSTLASRMQFVILRLAAGYTRAQIAKELGCSRKTIERWASEAGEQLVSVLAD